MLCHDARRLEVSPQHVSEGQGVGMFSKRLSAQCRKPIAEPKTCACIHLINNNIMKKQLIFLLLMLLGLTARAQDVILTQDDRVIKAYNVAVATGGQFVYYTLNQTDTATVQRLPKAQVFIIKKADGTRIDPNAPAASAQAPAATPAPAEVPRNRFPEIDLTNFHGLLCSKGNCVYVPIDGAYEGERAGQAQLKKLLEKDGFWTVVDYPEQAHFVFQGVLTTAAADRFFFVLRTRSSYQQKPTPLISSGAYSIKLGGSHRLYMLYSSEDAGRNVRVVNEYMSSSQFTAFKEEITETDFSKRTIKTKWAHRQGFYIP